ncbi:coagulation factor VIII [Spea bombifrons]|uniref:coagulation factor VIII n=1 Tax=Spea bombifrons TaxID=233779 RepID=UPI00234BE50E|nr:coagulation factor VIII [Spea bombifrons]
MRVPTILLQLSMLYQTIESITRTYYIAAVEKDWDYMGNSIFSPENRSSNHSFPEQVIYRKVVYVEYTDASFTRPKTQPKWTGILGPTIHAETFDSVVIHFKNLASIPCNLHGVGVSYGKNSEGGGYEDRTSLSEKGDDVIAPGRMHTYTWEIPYHYGPTESDPPCVTSAYFFHSNSTFDSNVVMVGPIVICKPGSLSQNGYQFGVQEKVLLFAVFDERNSHTNGKGGEELHTINGYTNGSLPEITLCHKKPLSLHVIGFGRQEIHSISLEGHSFVQEGHRVTMLPVTAFTFLTAKVQPGDKGIYNMSCRNPSHPAGTMSAQFKVEDCNEEPVKQMRLSNVYNDDEDEYYESNILEMTEDLSPIQVRSHGKYRFTTWTHYIAALEVQWHYSSDNRANSSLYTKAVYREFTDSQFHHVKPMELLEGGILGPVLRGEVGDQIQIMFKNMARHPFNIYPEGLSSITSEKPYLTGMQLKKYPVYPNESITYIWKVTKNDAPESSDSRCLTRYYSSSLHPQRDFASGLIGPLLICTKQTLDQRGSQIVTDKEHLLVFSVFDESISWYQEENFNQINGNTSQNKMLHVKSTKQTLVHNVNGLQSSLHINLCLNEVSLWHVLNLGKDTEFLSIQFGGNTFIIDSSYQDTLTLFPLSGETIVMVLEKTGHWIVAPLEAPLAQLGMTASFSVSRCGPIHDEIYQYDYKDFMDDFQKNASIHTQSKLKSPIVPRAMKNNMDFPTSEEYSKNIFQGSVVASDRWTQVKSNKDISTTTFAENMTNKAEISDEKARKDLVHNKMVIESVNQVEKIHTRSVYYDEYINKGPEDINLYEEDWDTDPRSQHGELRTYFIAAVELKWDYGFGKSPYFPKDIPYVPHGFPLYKKVAFREYLDSRFMEPATRGERDAHLGLLGPYIRAEINDEIIIHFKNMASRPYSFYTNIMTENGKLDEGVLPQQTHTYTWKISPQMGPMASEDHCKAWIYTSNVHPEKDFNSGLLGPFLVCRPQVLSRSFDRQLSVKDLSLFFMEIDETRSWYIRDNLQHHCPLTCILKMDTLCSPSCTFQTSHVEFKKRHIFHAINGHIQDTLPGLVLSVEEKIQWHLLNVGRHDILAIHFHGNVLTKRNHKERHLSMLNLYPGVSVTLEMVPHSLGLWRVESEGEHEDFGMKALYLVYDPRCRQPLGFSSGKIKNSQISASGYYGSWVPAFARLGNRGSINAWSVESVNSWIQVDLHMPTLIHELHTQGARQRFLNLYISQFVVFYSSDGEFWKPYQGNARGSQMVFFGNVDSTSVRKNLFDPPVIARFLRLHPTHTGARAALRMELFGCDITSCSLPLGLQTGALTPQHFSASSYFRSMFSSWLPNLARLNQRGRVNAWRPQLDKSGEWLQLDIGHNMKVTGVITQGARSAFTPMFITHFSLSFSKDGNFWETVQGSDGRMQIFEGNLDPDTPFWATLQPPVVTRFLRLHPVNWKGGIALRMEVLGCKIS